MSKTLAQIEAEKKELERQYIAIGAFMFNFSQLEWIIRNMLGDALSLSDDNFDVVTSSYDFSKLCSVTKAIYLKTLGCSDDDKKEIEEIFKACLGLNNDVRVHVAHGTWFIDESGSGAQHISRSSLQPTIKFSKIEDLDKETTKVEALKSRLVRFLRPATEGVKS